MNIKRKYIFWGIILIGIFFIIWNTFTQPGIRDLQVGFKERVFYRNEQNTGPVIRVYVVTVADTLWAEMKQYGNYMPHTKYGSTKVYFFRDNKPWPKQINESTAGFDERYQQYCIAVYEKNAMGQVSFGSYK